MGGKGHFETGETETSYSRDTLLQLKAFLMDSAAMSKSLGHLHCVSAGKLVEIAKTARPRAASDSAHPSVKNKSTTVMLKNIPVGYSRTGLCEELAVAGFGYAVDFLYLPIDRNTGLNMGHAFVNVRSRDAYRDFMKAFHKVPAQSCLPAFDSTGICEVSIAQTQGREANMRQLCSAVNIKSWITHDEESPLFLDDYGEKIPITQWQGREEEGKPRQCASVHGSPNLKPHAPPVLGSEQNGVSKKSSPPLRAEAKEFAPAMHPEAKCIEAAKIGEEKLVSSPFCANASAYPPVLRAEANEFVPSSGLLPESSFVD